MVRDIDAQINKLHKFPKELRKLAQFLIWRSIPYQGKMVKRPYSVAEPGKLCDATHPGNWTTFGAALELIFRDPQWNRLGFAFAIGGLIVGVDLDDCFDANGNLYPWAWALIQKLGPSYYEISPSGKGLKAWFRVTGAPLSSQHWRVKDYPGKVGEGETPSDKSGWEVHMSRRFFAVTGEAWEPEGAGWNWTPDRELPEVGETLRELIQEWGGKAPKVDQATGVVEIEQLSPVLTDEQVITLCKDTKIRRPWQVERFELLWADAPMPISAKGGRVDASNEDYELACHLGYFTQTPDQIVRIMKTSERVRDKWKREGYLDSTARNALEEKIREGEIYLNRHTITDANEIRAVKAYQESQGLPSILESPGSAGEPAGSSVEVESPPVTNAVEGAGEPSVEGAGGGSSEPPVSVSAAPEDDGEGRFRPGPGGRQELKNPHRLVRKYLKKFNHKGELTLTVVDDEGYKFSPELGIYLKESLKKQASHLNAFCDEEFRAHHQLELGAWLSLPPGNHPEAPRTLHGKPEPRPEVEPVTSSTDAAVFKAFKGVITPENVSKGQTGVVGDTNGVLAGEPRWLGTTPQSSTWDPLDCEVGTNGIIHTPSLMRGDPVWRIDHTPKFFAIHRVGYEIIPNAPKPTLWLRMLEDYWPDDPQTHREMQKWLGYNLTWDTGHQRMVLLLGDPGTGKGTIIRTIQAVVGQGLCTSPKLDNLAKDFGLWGLLGKKALTVGEVRLNHAKTQGIVTRLLELTGEDHTTVYRKNLPPVEARLRVKITLGTNFPFLLHDPSTALRQRMSVFTFTRKCYRGTPGASTLEQRLKAEYAAIRFWALHGLNLLQEDEGFLPIESSKEEVMRMENRANPLLRFMRECMEFGEEPQYRIPSAELASEWQAWCARENKSDNFHRNNFYEDILNTARGMGWPLEKKRAEYFLPTGESGGNRNCFCGARLKVWDRDQDGEREPTPYSLHAVD